MAVRYSNHAGAIPTPFGTALTSSGTILPSPSNGSRYLLHDFNCWLVDPSVAGTVTLTLGTVVLPPVVMGSSRSFFGHGPMTLPAETPVVATLGGSGSVGFYGSYLVATND